MLQIDIFLGFSELRNSLEGAEHLLQGLYASLREPLRSMFKVRGRSGGFPGEQW